MNAEAALSPRHLSTLAHCLSLEADLISAEGDFVTAGQLRDRAQLFRDMLSVLDTEH